MRRQHAESRMSGWEWGMEMEGLLAAKIFHRIGFKVSSREELPWHFSPLYAQTHTTQTVNLFFEHTVHTDTAKMSPNIVSSLSQRHHYYVLFVGKSGFGAPTPTRTDRPRLRQKHTHKESVLMIRIFVSIICIPNKSNHAKCARPFSRNPKRTH